MSLPHSSIGYSQAIVYIKQDDPELPTFHFDSVINPISAYKVEKQKKSIISEIELDDEELNSLAVEDDLVPLLFDEPLCNKDTSNGIALYQAPKPFSQRSGKCRRSFDVPLVSSWFKVEAICRRGARTPTP